MDSQTKKAQLEKTFQAFRESPKTTKMVEVETGIQRANLTRYVAYFRKRKKIVEVEKARCPITKHKATFYSTDPEYFKPETQAEMFEPETCGV